MSCACVIQLDIIYGCQWALAAVQLNSRTCYLLPGVHPTTRTWALSLSKPSHKLPLAPLAPLALPPSNCPLLTIASYAQVVPKAPTNSPRRVFRTCLAEQSWLSHIRISKPFYRETKHLDKNTCAHKCIKLPYGHMVVYCPTRPQHKDQRTRQTTV